MRSAPRASAPRGRRNRLRLMHALAATEAANGIIMFGWTTTLIVSFVSKVREQLG